MAGAQNQTSRTILLGPIVTVETGERNRAPLSHFCRSIHPASPLQSFRVRKQYNRYPNRRITVILRVGHHPRVALDRTRIRITFGANHLKLKQRRQGPDDLPARDRTSLQYFREH